MNKYLPFLDWLSNYNKEHFSGDISAGITVGIMLIPQGMAYALLAGLPPIYGLYGATVPLIIYGLLGTSRQLSVAPAAVISIIIASSLTAYSNLPVPEYLSLCLLLSFMVGITQLLMGFLRLGFIVNFLAKPVISGFISGAALIIFSSQLKNMLGINIPRGKFFQTIYNVGTNINQVNLPTLTVGLASVVIILFFKKKLKKIPGQVVVVILGILAAYVFELNDYGVKIIKDIPSGLPAFGFPDISQEKVRTLLPTAITIAFIIFLQCSAMAKVFQAKHKYYEIDANQELRAFGMANLIGSFFQAFPVSASMSRSAVNDQSGAKTGLASIISAFIILLTLLFLTDLFYFLPYSILSSIIMVAVLSLFDKKAFTYLWKTDKVDFGILIITFIVTLGFGIEQGVLIGVIVSLIMLIYRASYPHIAELALVKNTTQYRNVNRFDDLEDNDQMLILRFDAQLFFANADYFTDRVKELSTKKENLELIIIDAATMSYLDSTAINSITNLVSEYRKQNVVVKFVGAIGPVRDKLKRTELVDFIGRENFAMCIHDAVNDFNGNTTDLDEKYYLQNN